MPTFKKLEENDYGNDSLNLGTRRTTTPAPKPVKPAPLKTTSSPKPVKTTPASPSKAKHAGEQIGGFLGFMRNKIKDNSGTAGDIVDNVKNNVGDAINSLNPQGSSDSQPSDESWEDMVARLQTMDPSTQEYKDLFAKMLAKRGEEKLGDTPQPTEVTPEVNPLEQAINDMLGVAEGNQKTYAEIVGGMQLASMGRGTEAIAQTRRGMSAAGKAQLANQTNEEMKRQGGQMIDMLSQKEREEILASTSEAINLLMAQKQSGESMADAWENLDYTQQQMITDSYIKQAALSNDFSMMSGLIDAGVVSYENAYANFNTQLQRMQDEAEAGLFSDIFGGLGTVLGGVVGAVAGNAPGAVVGAGAGNALGRAFGSNLGG